MHTEFTKQHTQPSSIFHGQVNSSYKDNAFFPYFLMAMSQLLMRPTFLNRNYLPTLAHQGAFMVRLYLKKFPFKMQMYYYDSKW